jgi:hypothetical protein
MAGQKHVFNPLLGLGLDAVGDPDGISAIEDREAISKLLITVGNKQYLVPRDPYEAPKNPTMTAGNTQATAAVAQKSVTISCATSGAAIYYTTNGDDPTASSTAYNNGITLYQSAEQAVRAVTIKAVAIKNGIASDIVSTTYYIARQAGTPVIAAESGSTDYDLSRLCTISEKSSNGETLHYATGDTNASSSSTQITTGSSITLNSTTRVTAIATKSGWLDSEVAEKTITVGKKKCYIGQAASVTTAADVEALTVKSSSSDTAVSGYKEDTLHGKTKDVFCGTTENDRQYVWFAIPKGRVTKVNNEYKKLKVQYTASGFTSPLQIAADESGVGTVIGDYVVWRSKSQVFGQYAFEISLI